MAQIRDLIDDTQPVEEITFSTEEISPSDLQLVAPGAVFYWRIGYVDEVNGQRRRTSDFSFRRLPQWREKDIAPDEIMGSNPRTGSKPFNQ